ncbi:MAG: ABC transporter permease, partial [Chloroflexi bacterium]|nr:ABC transporter permease [Chloroflexota bacterium]
MREYVIKRLTLMIPSLLGVSLIVFMLGHLLPGDVVVMMLSETGSGASVDTAALRSRLGLDKPLH